MTVAGEQLTAVFYFPVFVKNGNFTLEMPDIKSIPRHVLPVIVLAQFAGTSLWFAGNAIAADLRQAFSLADSATGNLTSAVQLGFITGTLVFAVLSPAEPPSLSRTEGREGGEEGQSR